MGTDVPTVPHRPGVVTDSLSYLLGLERFGIKFGLDAVQALVGRLGHPERTFQSVHIAGTNGKGSVTAMVDAALRRAGHRSARYTSPHLVDITERFVVDGRPVTMESLAETVADVRDAIEALRSDGTLRVQPTFFEVTTAVAFEVFRRAGVGTAVLEVGLGGRLDATNIVSPVVTAISSIALDHQKYLGPTIRHIAVEKAGIIKPGVPVVVGRVEGEAFDAIAAVARARGAPLLRAWDGVRAAAVPQPHTTGAPSSCSTRIRLRTPAREYGDVVLGLRGAHQVGNAVVAVRVLESLDAQGIAVPRDAVIAGLQHPEWSGRLDLRPLPDGREALLDAAHNPAGAQALASYLRECSMDRLPLVFAVMRDKDVAGMLGALLPAVGRIVLTQASNPRSADPEHLAIHVRTMAPELPWSIAPTPSAAIADAWRCSRRIIVAGSIFLLGDVMKEIG